MIKKIAIILLIVIININNVGCTSQVVKNSDLVDEMLTFEEEEDIQYRVEIVTRLAEEQASYVYDNIFYKNDLNESERHIIDEANSMFHKYYFSTIDIPEKLVITLYNQAKELYDSVNGSTEQDIKNLLSSYYISRYSLSYYSFYRDYNSSQNSKNVDILLDNTYDLLSKLHNYAVPNEIADDEIVPFYQETIFGNAEIIDVRDKFDVITGEKDVLKYQYLKFYTNKDKVNAQNIQEFINNVVKESSAYHDYRGIYVVVDNNSKELYFNPITESQRKNWNNRRHGVNYKKNIRQDEIFEYDNCDYIISNNKIVELK